MQPNEVIKLVAAIAPPLDLDLLESAVTAATAPESVGLDGMEAEAACGFVDEWREAKLAEADLYAERAALALDLLRGGCRDARSLRKAWRVLEDAAGKAGLGPDPSPCADAMGMLDCVLADRPCPAVAGNMARISDADDIEAENAGAMRAWERRAKDAGREFELRVRLYAKTLAGNAICMLCAALRDRLDAVALDKLNIPRAAAAAKIRLRLPLPGAAESVARDFAAALPALE